MDESPVSPERVRGAAGCNCFNVTLVQTMAGEHQTAD
jgi:hypothetical protein